MRFAGIVVVGLALGCGPFETKIPSSTKVDVPGQGILGGNPLVANDVFPSELIGEALAQSINQSFDTSGYDKGLVKSLKLTLLSLTVLEPEEGGQQVRDLGFLTSLAVFLGAPGEPLEVAASDEGAFNDGPIEYDVPLTGAELAEAFKAADSLEMTADVVPGDPPQFATEIEISSEITVQISPF